MPTQLNLFPSHVPIGVVTDSAGNQRNVMMTAEFTRALSDLLIRVGGPSAMGLGDIAGLLGHESVDVLGQSALRAVAIMGIRAAAAAEQSAARVAVLERRIEDLARLVNSTGPAPVDWEHPGKIGASSANTGQFTAATVTTLNRIKFTQPAATATLTLANNKTFAVTDSVTISGNDGSTLNIGAGGVLGAAAYKDTTAFASSSNTALPGAATDAASTQNLANAIRAILLSVRIGA